VSEREIVTRALAYPYEAPTRSFLQAGEETLPLRDRDLDPSGRLAVLAFGSNAAPEVLRRKFRAEPGGLRAPAVRSAIRDHDVVYSAHVSAYGSVPATLQVSPGTTATAFVLFLTERQLSVLARTEPNYRPAELSGFSCELETGAVLTSALAFLSRHGCLAVDGGEVALAAVEASGRRFPALSEPQALEHVRALLSPQTSIEKFIEGSVADVELAEQRTAALRRTAKRFAGAAQTVANRRRARRASAP
jgi:hypothetical protein